MSNDDPTRPSSEVVDDRTRTLRAAAREPSKVPSSSSLDGGRFAPGTILAGRYRLVALLGRGGMGEVYRAEDLKLGEPVALKFLPQHLSFDGAALARFHREVRVARQIAHRNVCRVHDIGEADGDHFLTMEYIDGEDLSTLLRRIGRLPQDKAAELAGQVCRGLAAAHEAGVLHRDLKPANVMIDGRGRAKITDFGLAYLQDEMRAGSDEEHFVGTPAYMAPEQLRGEELSTRSDVYALGLVLYEMFTGTKAFEDEDWRRLVARGGRSGPPADPASRVEGLDRGIVRVLLRCLEDAPDDRPRSALEIAAALPGGDPLRAALEAGETPSPEMVAAARDGEVSMRFVAASLLASALLIGANLWLSDARLHLSPSRIDDHPEVSAREAEELLRELGHPEIDPDQAPSADRLWRWTSDFAALRYVEENSADRAELVRRLGEGSPSAARFHYAEGSRPLGMDWGGHFRGEFHRVALDVGTRSVQIDPRGHLLSLRVQSERGPAPPGDPDWQAALAATGYPQGDLVEVTPEAPIDVRIDRARAWVLGDESDDSAVVRIELGSFGDRIVYAEVTGPWTPAPDEGSSGTAPTLVLYFVVIVAGLFGAQLHLRAGRADVAGASKVAGTLLVLKLVHLLVASRWSGANVGVVFFRDLILAFGNVALLALIWLAIEPTVRRSAPRLLVSMTRLLAGHWRDARVGRDVLLGVTAGAFMAILARFGGESGPIGGVQWLGQGTELFTFWMSGSANLALFAGSGLVLVYAGLLRLSGREWVAALVIFLLFSATVPVPFPASLLAGAVIAAIVGFAGLLTLVVTVLVREILVFWPLTLDTGAWYFDQTVLACVILTAFCLWGWLATARPKHSTTVLAAR